MTWHPLALSLLIRHIQSLYVSHFICLFHSLLNLNDIHQHVTPRNYTVTRTFNGRVVQMRHSVQQDLLSEQVLFHADRKRLGCTVTSARSAPSLHLLINLATIYIAYACTPNYRIT